MHSSEAPRAWPDRSRDVWAGPSDGPSDGRGRCSPLPRPRISSHAAGAGNEVWICAAGSSIGRCWASWVLPTVLLKWQCLVDVKWLIIDTIITGCMVFELFGGHSGVLWAFNSPGCHFYCSNCVSLLWGWIGREVRFWIVSDCEILFWLQLYCFLLALYYGIQFEFKWMIVQIMLSQFSNFRSEFLPIVSLEQITGLQKFHVNKEIVALSFSS